MAAFDYGTAAELLPARNAAEAAPVKARRSRQPIGYGRFARAADAIRFAIEELPPSLLAEAHLNVDGESFGGDRIRRLYESAQYPLARGVARR